MKKLVFTLALVVGSWTVQAQQLPLNFKLFEYCTPL